MLTNSKILIVGMLSQNRALAVDFLAFEKTVAEARKMAALIKAANLSRAFEIRLHIPSWCHEFSYDEDDFFSDEMFRYSDLNWDEFLEEHSMSNLHDFIEGEYPYLIYAFNGLTEVHYSSFIGNFIGVGPHDAHGVKKHE